METSDGLDSDATSVLYLTSKMTLRALIEEHHVDLSFITQGHRTLVLGARRSEPVPDQHGTRSADLTGMGPPRVQVEDSSIEVSARPRRLDDSTIPQLYPKGVVEVTSKMRHFWEQRPGGSQAHVGVCRNTVA